MTDTLAVQASAVQFAYGERQALRGVDFEVQKGAAFGFLGPCLLYTSDAADE